MDMHSIKHAMTNNYYSRISDNSLDFYICYYFKTCTHCHLLMLSYINKNIYSRP